MIASEYGGGPRAILEGVYVDELVPMIKQINRRRIKNYKMQVMITHTSDPKKLLRQLDESDSADKPVELDTSGMEALKFAMSGNPRIIVK